MMGAFGANHHLRQSLVFLNMPTMQQPEAYIGGSEELFDIKGNLIHTSTANYLKKFMEAYSEWVRTHS
jgi:chromate reductase